MNALEPYFNSFSVRLYPDSEVEKSLITYEKQTVPVVVELQLTPEFHHVNRALYLGKRVHRALQRLRECGQISDRPLAHVAVQIKGHPVNFEALFFQVNDLEKKEKYHTIGLAIDQQMVFLEDSESPQPFDNNQYIIDLLKEKNRGHLLADGEEAAKKTVSIAKVALPSSYCNPEIEKFKIDAVDAITKSIPLRKID